METSGFSPPDVPIVSFVLVAEFDIEKGSYMKEQYPGPLRTPPSWKSDGLTYPDLVANMMHPDGVQRQEWDYNYFLLHRPEDESFKEAQNDWELIEESSTKQIDLSTLVPSSVSSESTLFAINCVTCNRNQEVKRGATVLAISILSEFPSVCLSDGWATGIMPILRAFLSKALENPTETKRMMAELYQSFNKMDIAPSYRVLSSVRDLDFSTKPFFLQTSVEFQNCDFSVCLPISAYAKSFSGGSIMALIRRLGLEATLQLYRAILLEKNILFVGYGVPNDVLCHLVISCSLLVPMIEDLMASRLFPYVNLNDFTFAETKGFIAGTNNPVLQKSCPCEVLVDLEKDEVSIVSRAEGIPKQGTQKARHLLRALGKNLLEETTKILLQGHNEEFQKKLEIGILQLRCSETWLRRRFIEETTIIAEMCLNLPEIPDSVSEFYGPSKAIISQTFWFHNLEKQRSMQDGIINRINSSMRHIWYSLHGHRPSEYRSVYICPALDHLVQAVVDDYTLLMVAKRLMFYFGEVDLSDAIEFVTRDQHDLLIATRLLNVKLLTLYSDSKILLTLQCCI